MSEAQEIKLHASMAISLFTGCVSQSQASNCLHTRTHISEHLQLRIDTTTKHCHSQVETRIWQSEACQLSLSFPQDLSNYNSTICAPYLIIIKIVVVITIQYILKIMRMTMMMLGNSFILEDSDKDLLPIKK